MASTPLHDRLALSQGIWWIADQPAGISYRGFSGGARRGIADRHISLCINVNAGHPSPQAVSAVVKGLLLRWSGGNCTSGDIELMPADRGGPGPILIVIYSLRRVDRFNPAEVLIDQRIH